MKTLKGSCSCGSVKFEVKSDQYYPYQRCYCSICRKTQGGGGYAINLSADATTLKIKGKAHLKVYRARVKNPEDSRAHASTAQRNFCGRCGSALWLFSPEWPDLLHPFASAIDSPLPKVPDSTHLMLNFKSDWVSVCAGKKDRKFRRYPKESIEAWHAWHRRSR